MITTVKAVNKSPFFYSRLKLIMANSILLYDGNISRVDFWRLLLPIKPVKKADFEMVEWEDGDAALRGHVRSGL